MSHDKTGGAHTPEETEEEAEMIPTETHNDKEAEIKEASSSDDNGKASNDEPEVIVHIATKTQSKESKESNESKPEDINAKDDQILESPRKDFEEILSPLSQPEKLIVDEATEAEVHLEGVRDSEEPIQIGVPNGPERSVESGFAPAPPSEISNGRTETGSIIVNNQLPSSATSNAAILA